MIAETLFRIVLSQMVERYRAEREARRRELLNKYRSEVVFVHELVQCPLKRIYSARYRAIDEASLYNPRFIVGQMIEDAAKLHLSSEIDLESRNVEKLIEVDGQRVVVAGSIDAYSSGHGAIEIKYLTGLYNTPHDHHIKQLAIYLNLAGLQKGELLQISPEGIKSVEVSPISDDELARMVRNTLTGETAPLYDWECKLCQYEFICPRSVAREKR
jgi:CRISPR-associated exonuclease Cas4